MDKEIKMLFELAYYPVMYANQRLNGGDFLSVAIPLMDALRQQINDENKLKRAARQLVLEFNNLLTPKMSVSQIDDTINMIYNPSDLTRAMAKYIADENVKKLGH